MRTIINWIRSLFCKHDFLFEEGNAKTCRTDNQVIRQGTKVSRTCKKCGWHKSYWKY